MRFFTFLLFIFLLLASSSLAVASEPHMITVRGGGYGHGFGMSQYGAEGAARQGLSHGEILSFYYPGTTVESGSGLLRVWLSRDADGRLTLPRQEGLSVKMNKTSIVLPSRARAWRVRSVDARMVVEQRVKGVWRSAPRKLGLSEDSSGTMKFFVSGKPIVIKDGGQTRAYRGSISPLSSGTRILTLNHVSLEAYLSGVVALEMPSYWAEEALKAQAIAARTYALRERADSRSQPYDLCDTSACQVYGGVEAETPSTDGAVRSTRNRGLRYQDTWALTQFSASNGGFVKAGSQPYLVAKSDPYDGWAGNPYHSWATEVDMGKLATRYGLGSFVSVRIVRASGPYPDEVLLTGSAGSKTFSGWDFRNAAGLRSPLFSFVK